VKTGPLNQKSENQKSQYADSSGSLPDSPSESDSASGGDCPQPKQETSVPAAASKAPICAVSKDTEEYHLQREQQYKDGLKTLVRSLLLFGILAMMWLALQYLIN